MPLWVIYALVGFSALTFAYTLYQMRKMNKRTQTEPSQLDGTIVGEGTISHDIAGSPHLYGNDVDIFNFDVQPITQKTGKK